MTNSITKCKYLDNTSVALCILGQFPHGISFIAVTKKKYIVLSTEQFQPCLAKSDYLSHGLFHWKLACPCG